MEEGYNQFTYNQFLGESPKMTIAGLPSIAGNANLPTSIPHGRFDDLDPTTDSMQDTSRTPYSPQLVEKGGHNNGSTKAVPLEQPVKPPMWATVMNGVLNATIGISSSNSAGTVATQSTVPSASSVKIATNT